MLPGLDSEWELSTRLSCVADAALGRDPRTELWAIHKGPYPASPGHGRIPVALETVQATRGDT